MWGQYIRFHSRGIELKSRKIMFRTRVTRHWKLWKISDLHLGHGGTGDRLNGTETKVFSLDLAVVVGKTLFTIQDKINEFVSFCESFQWKCALPGSKSISPLEAKLWDRPVQQKETLRPSHFTNCQNEHGSVLDVINSSNNNRIQLVNSLVR